MKKRATKKPAAKRQSSLRWHDLQEFIEKQKRQTPQPLPSIPVCGPDEDAFWEGQPTGIPQDMIATNEGYPAFDSFVGEIKQLFGKSVSKGYGPMQPDDPNMLYAFMQEFFSDDHALGEIVYKAIRYKNKRNPEDLVKIAGWAWLVFMHHWRKEAELGN